MYAQRARGVRRASTCCSTTPASRPTDDASVLDTVARGVAARAGRQPQVGLPLLQARHPAPARRRRRLGDQHRVVRRGDGRGDVADLLHGVQGRRAGAVARARRRVRAPRACASTRSAPARSTRRCCASCSPSDPEQAARRLVHVPMGRFAEAREIANAALFLASDESSLRHRVDVPGRRRAVRRLRHPAVALPAPAVRQVAPLLGGGALPETSSMASTELRIFTAAMAVETAHLLDDGLRAPARRRHRRALDADLDRDRAIVAVVIYAPSRTPGTRDPRRPVRPRRPARRPRHARPPRARSTARAGSDYTGFGQAAAGARAARLGRVVGAPAGGGGGQPTRGALREGFGRVIVGRLWGLGPRTVPLDHGC